MQFATVVDLVFQLGFTVREDVSTLAELIHEAQFDFAWRRLRENAPLLLNLEHL